MDLASSLQSGRTARTSSWFMASFLDLPGASDNLLNPIFQKYCINAIFNFIDKNEELPGPL